MRKPMLPGFICSLCVACLVCLASVGSGQGDPGAFMANQIQRYWIGMMDPSIQFRVQRIWRQLIVDTGEMHPVFPAQQFTAGQALPNGAILLDVSIAADANEEVTAFFLSHEYGHQMLRHPQIGATAVGQYLMAVRGVRSEDEADCWAARFLKRHDYDFEPVVDFLRELPSGGPGDAHSSGPQRARHVQTCGGLRSSGSSRNSRSDDDSDTDDRPRRGTRTQPSPQVGRICATQFGTCPMVRPQLVGAPCTCVTGAGYFPGVTQ